MLIKIKRDTGGGYKTDDGFRIWQELPGFGKRRWYVYHDNCEEELYFGGFLTKWEAVAWLQENHASLIEDMTS